MTVVGHANMTPQHVFPTRQRQHLIAQHSRRSCSRELTDSLKKII